MDERLVRAQERLEQKEAARSMEEAERALEAAAQETINPMDLSAVERTDDVWHGSPEVAAEPIESWQDGEICFVYTIGDHYVSQIAIREGSGNELQDVLARILQNHGLGQEDVKLERQPKLENLRPPKTILGRPVQMVSGPEHSTYMQSVIQEARRAKVSPWLVGILAFVAGVLFRHFFTISAS